MKRIVLIFLLAWVLFNTAAREVSETVVIQPRRPRPCRCTTTVIEYCGICCMKEDGIRCCPGHPREVPLNHDYACSGYYPAEYSTEYYTVPDSFSDDPLSDAAVMEDRAETVENQGTKTASQAEDKLETEVETLLGDTGLPEETAREAQVVSSSQMLVEQERLRRESPETGDPVCLSTGEYVSTVVEGSLPVGELNISIQRKYRSQGSSESGLFGTLWHSSLEDRILRGNNPLSEELVALQIRANNNAELTAHEIDLLRSQTLDSLDKNIEELNQKLSLCHEALDSFSQERETASHEKFKNFFDGLSAAFIKTSGELENSLDCLKQKRQRLEETLFPEAMDLVNHLVQHEWKNALVSFQNQNKLSQANQKLTEIEGPEKLPAHWGNGTITLINEQGTPLLFNIDEEPRFETSVSLDGTDIPNYYPRGSSLTGSPDLDFTLLLTPSGQYLRQYIDGSVKYYDIKGKPVRWEDRNGRGVNYIYQEGTGVIRQMTTDDGRTIFFNTDNGMIKEIHFPQGRERSYQYEGTKLVSVTNGRGDCIRYEYQDTLLTRVIKPDGSFRQYRYASDEVTGKMVVIEGIDEEGGRELFSYDFKDARGTYVGARGEEIHHFDSQLRVVKIEYSDGSREEWDYEEDGLLKWYRDRRGDIYGYRYDQQGKQSAIMRNGVILEERVFSKEGYLREERFFHQGHSTSLEYVRDSKGRILSRLLLNFSETGSRGEQRYSYHTGSAEGLVSTYQDAEGHQVFYEYDERGFLISRRESLTCYLAGGGEARQERREEYIKTDDDKLEERRLYEDGRLVLHHRYLWDSEARLTGVFDLMNQIYIDKRVYNNRGDMIERWDHRGALWKVRYDRCHRPLEILNPLGEQQTLSYDELGRLKERRLFSKQGDVFESWRFSYDRAGRKILEEELVSGITREYSYYPGGEMARERRYHREVPQETITREYYYNLAYPGITVPGAGRTVKTVDQGVWTSWEIFAADSEKLLCRISPGGRVTTWNYNGFGDLSEKSGFGGVFRYRFDREGRVIEEFQAGVNTLLDLDGRGRIRLLLNQAGEELERRSYDALDKLVYRRNPLGGEETFLYDSQDRIIQRTGCDGTSEAWHYPSGERADYTDQEGYTWRLKYDKAGRQICMMDPGGFETLRGYDPRGRLTMVSDPEGGTYRFRYNPDGMLLETENPLKMKTTFSYDPLGRPLASVNPAGVQFNWRYTHEVRDGTPVLVTSRLIEGQLVSREYSDGDGLLTRKEMPSGAAYQWEYDGSGRPVAEINWAGNKKEYHYQNEIMTEISDFEGRIRRFTYNSSGLLVREDGCEGDQNNYQYDAMGNLIEASGFGECHRFSYDRTGRLVSQENQGDTIDYEYTPRGQIARMNWSSGETAIFHYNPQGKRTEIIDYSGTKTSFFYDSCGRIIQEMFPNGLIRDFSYDAAGRLQREILKKGSGLSAQILNGTCYGYDSRGLVVSEVFLDGGFNAYRYDHSGRLVQAVYPDTAERRDLSYQIHKQFGQEPSPVTVANSIRTVQFFSSAQESWLTALKEEMEVLFKLFPQRGFSMLNKNQSLWNEIYLFDGDGNKIEARDGFGRIEYRYDHDDPHAVSHAGNVYFKYDREGNLTEIINSEEAEFFRYNSQGLMIEYEEQGDDDSWYVSYLYDGLGRRCGAVRNLRTIRGEETGFYETWTYQGISFLPLQRKVVSGVPGEPSKPQQSGIASRIRILGSGNGFRGEESLQTYLYNDQKLVYFQSQGREPSFSHYSSSSLKQPGTFGASLGRYLLTDFRGSLTGIFYKGGDLTTTRTYSTHGSFLSSQDDFIPLGFGGKPLDPVTNLYGFGFRDYHPRLGLFISRDPVKDGSNWYGYCHHDPVNFIDLLGLDDVYAVYNDSGRSMDVTYVNTTDFGAAPLVQVTRMTATNNVRNEIDPNNIRLLPDVMTSPENQSESPRYYYPRKFPQGIHRLTAEITTEGMDDVMGKYNINTDATQWVPTYRDSEGKIPDRDQLDGGYRIHSGTPNVESSTLGCIRLIDEDVELIWDMVSRSNDTNGIALLSVGCNN